MAENAWRPRLERALPYALFGAVTLAVFWKFLLFGHTLHSIGFVERHAGRPIQTPTGWFRSERPSHTDREDSMLLLPAQLRIYNEGLKQGELRLWNPTLFCGYPLYANPIVHPFYPPHLALHAALPPVAAYEINLALHLFFSGVALYAALRALKRSRAGATAGGLIWMLFGTHRTWFSTGVLAGASVFVPLALLGLVRCRERKDLSSAALAGAAMGMAILGSHPQHALLFFLFLLAWSAAVMFRDREGRRFAALSAAVFGLSSIGVGLVAILMRLDTLANGYRRAGDIGALYPDSLSVMSHVFGLALGKVYFPSDPLLEGEFTLYVGLAGLALALAGAIREFRDPAVRFLAIFGGATLLIVFVRPLAEFSQLLPLLNLSLPTRWLCVTGFCLAVLAAYGLDALAKELGRLPVALALATGVFLLVCLVGLGPLRLSNGAAIETALGFGLAAAAAGAARRHPRTGLVLCFAALLFDLLPHFILFNSHADAWILRETPEAVEVAKRRERAPWRATGDVCPARPPDLWELSHGNNLLALHGVENVAGYEAIIPTHYLLFCRAANGELAGAGRVLAFATFESRLLDMAGLKYVFLPARVSPDGRLRLVGEYGSLRLYENPSALPRAYLVSRVLPASNEEDAFRLLSSSEFDPRTSVILETRERIPPLEDPPRGHVEWIERSPDRLALQVTAKGPAILVLSETDYPGWEAEIDGRPTPIYRANVAFRAVEVPSGDHAVRFRFRPASARTGAIGSALFLLLTLGFSWARAKKDRR